MPRKEKQYKKAREDFDRMDLGDRASFLIEATFSTAADALDRAGKELADMVDEFDSRSRTKEKSGKSDKAGPSKENGDRGQSAGSDASSNQDESTD